MTGSNGLPAWLLSVLWTTRAGVDALRGLLTGFLTKWRRAK